MRVVGVIGMGFVGSAVANGLRTRARARNNENRLSTSVMTYDKFRADKSDCDLTGIVEDAEICFVCVPTPMLEDGSSDISIVRSVVNQLSALTKVCNRRLPLVVVIKSTVPPDTCSSLQQEFPNVDIVFNPEFLTEANAETDFIDQDRIVIGHGPDNEAALTVVQLYNSLFSCPIYLTDWTTAEMVKYTANCFLATKVSFANEIKQITDSLELNYDEVIRLATLDKRLGNSHWQVPGPMVASDGSGRYLPGFSGSCFIKDINALINVAKSSGVSPTVLQAAWHKNVEVRPERDWEALVGRAISNNEESK